MTAATLKDMIIEDEGTRLTPYWDVEGNLTIGIGRNLGIRITDRTIRDAIRMPRRPVITLTEAHMMCDNDIAECEVDLFRACPWLQGLSKLSDRRRWVLVGMVFNMGISRFLTFKRMLSSLKNEDFLTAAEEILDSVAARRLPGRYSRYAQMMREG